MIEISRMMTILRMKMMIMMIVKGRSAEPEGCKRADTAVSLPSLEDGAQQKRVAWRRSHRRWVGVHRMEWEAARAYL